MMRTEHKKTHWKTLFILCIVVGLFLVGRRDKSRDKEHHNRGLAYWKKGEHDQAISHWTVILEVAPGHTKAYIYRGAAYDEKGEYELAISDFNNAIERDPRLAMAYYNRAGAYYSKGEYNKAWEDVHKAQSMGRPVSPEFLKDLREASGRER